MTGQQLITELSFQLIKNRTIQYFQKAVFCDNYIIDTKLEESNASY